MRVTADKLRQLLDYDPSTGIFRRRIEAVCGKGRVVLKAGDVVGGKTKNGYISIHFGGCRAYAHRLAWLYVHGEFPPHHIDHINGDRADNRIDNLRPATAQQNQSNSKRPATNSSGLKGVTYRKSSGRYLAQINHAGRHYHLGSFPTAEQAHAAYAEASARLHGPYGRNA